MIITSLDKSYIDGFSIYKNITIEGICSDEEFSDLCEKSRFHKEVSVVNKEHNDAVAVKSNKDTSLITKVIFNDPATIVLWNDGTKTVVKCQEGDIYDKEKGLALCIAKKALGNKSNFNNEFKRWEKNDSQGCIKRLGVGRLNLVQETVDCIRNTFNQNTESDKLIRNCMALLQNAIDGEYHDMEEVDVSELKRPHGEWIEGYHDYFETLDCSLCGYVRNERHSNFNFCPNCGASMRREKEE